MHRLTKIVIGLVLSCISIAVSANDPYQDWLTFEQPFSGLRKLTTDEQTWLERLAAFENAQPYTIDVQPPIWAATTDVENPVSYQPDVVSDVDVVFTAPKQRLSVGSDAQGINIAMAGQTISLPRLIVNEPRGTFLASLSYWMGRELSVLRRPIQAMQQEAGWSDYEVQQLIRLYARSVFDTSQVLAFETAYWVQAGYGVQLGRSEEQWVLLWSMPRAVPGLTMVRQQNRWWALPSDAELDTVSLMPVADTLDGQSIRLTSLTPRIQTSQFERLEFWFDNGQTLRSVRWEIPRHWAQVAWRPADFASRFAEPLPNYLLSQMSELTATDDVLLQAQLISQWLMSEFEQTEQPLSVQQAFIFQTQTVETRFVTLAQWWRYQTGQSAALLRHAGQWWLALALPESMNVATSVENRGRRWWLFSESLTSNTTVTQDAETRWVFLP